MEAMNLGTEDRFEGRFEEENVRRMRRNCEQSTLRTTVYVCELHVVQPRMQLELSSRFHCHPCLAVVEVIG